MKIISYSVINTIFWDDKAIKVYEDWEVFPSAGDDCPPVCPCCKGNPPPRSQSIQTLGLLEQKGFWDNVAIAICHCGWCNGDFAVRQFTDGEFDVGEESQSVLPIGGMPEFTNKTMGGKVWRRHEG